MQESHQMGLDTRENAMPVTSDTGDTGVTSPAELQWAGNAPEPPAVPWTPVLLPLPNIPMYSSCPWKIQTQKLQHDTGILPSLHACNKSSKCSLAGKAKLGRASCNDSWRKPRKGACKGVFYSITKNQGGGAHKVLPMGKEKTASPLPNYYPPNLSCSLAWSPLPRSSWSCSYLKPKVLF